MNYLQKKKQAIIMLLAAQIIKTAEGYPVTVNDCESGAAVDYTVWGNTVPVKNLIPYPYYQTTRTSNGITFTDNGDGSITVNGTATAQAQFFINTSIIDFVDKTKVYVLSGGKDSNVVLRLDFVKEKTWKKLIDTGADGKAIIDFTKINVEYDRLNVSLIVKANAVCDNITIKPQLELGETATEYELYTENYVGDKTKNLLPYPYYETTKTENGITFTDNGDGSVTANGTATADTWFILQSYADLKGTYTLSGCQNGSKTTYILGLGDSDHPDVGNGVTGRFNGKANIFIRVYNGAVLDNVVFKPQLELGETATAYEPYGYKIPLVNSAKNLISYPYINTTKTVNGITFTDNGDGTVTANGTATGEAVFRMSCFTVKNGVTYYLSGCPKGGSKTTYYFHFRGYDVDVGNGLKIAPTYDFYNNFEIVIKQGAVLDNLIFKPQFEIGAAATEYEPYRTPATANIYLDKPLKKGESVNFGTDRLPELQLFEGSNIVTADTDVKPEKISIDYYTKESD